MGFDPAASGYVDVAHRVQQFFAKYPDGSIQSDPPLFIEKGGKDWVIIRAAAYRAPDDPRPGIGTAWELIPGRTPYTKDSEVMNAETSAWGRALGALGIATNKSIATADEIAFAKARAASVDLPALMGEFEACKSEDELKALAQKHADAIAHLPERERTQFRDLYSERLAALRAE